ncbi:hypothetical protein EWM64_g7740 [Hericium alpestre]|uniref:DNA replication regulator Sld3 C-terminal domain-containing protein n=1 Tax=Hericium alpestre TaxID=135208 RepID=A0A4Y9ZNA3_9AGAM|nr:hypothetical protein EWM64_g7740 [Hericium alpestre]
MVLPATDAEQGAFDAEGTQQQAAVSRDLRDWTQEFCEDIVQPLFATKLPHLYRLLRMRLFRIPQWSEDDDEQPDDLAPKTSRPASRARDPVDDLTQRASGSRAPSRSRSRSLSVSLSQGAAAAQHEPQSHAAARDEHVEGV